MAVSSVAIEELPYPRWYFWLRIPFQAVFITWVLWAGSWIPRSPAGKVRSVLDID